MKQKKWASFVLAAAFCATAVCAQAGHLFAGSEESTSSSASESSEECCCSHEKKSEECSCSHGEHCSCSHEKHDEHESCSCSHDHESATAQESGTPSGEAAGNAKEGAPADSAAPSEAVKLYTSTKEEALKLFGFEKAPASVVPVSWTDATYLLAAGVPVAGLPDNHHLPEEILKKHVMITDHDGKFDFEKLKEIKPELVFANEKTLEKSADLKSFLDEQKIAVKAFPSAKTVNEVLELVAKTGLAFGTETEMEKNLKALHDRVEAAKESVKDLSNRKVAVISVTKDGRSILKGDTITASVLETLGLENVASSMELKGEADAQGMVPAPSFKELAEKETGAIVLMVRIKGDKTARDQAIADIETEITEAFGADSEMVKNHRYDVVDHHGLIIAIPNIVAGIENVADIASR